MRDSSDTEVKEMECRLGVVEYCTQTSRKKVGLQEGNIRKVYEFEKAALRTVPKTK